MFCPSCRSEYRPGITSCKKCEVALVESIDDEMAPILEGDATVAVGISGEHGLSHVVGPEGEGFDLRKCFPYDVAVELVRDLEAERVASVLREVPGKLFQDKKPRYEVRVRDAEAERATHILHERWRRLAEAEAGGPVAPPDVDKCPACGATVPLDVEECPDCGLTVGVAEGDEADAPA